jgi:hypothetical protein
LFNVTPIRTHNLAVRLLAAILLSLAGTCLLASAARAGGPDVPAVLIDAGIEGNAPDAPGETQDCVSVPVGAAFQVDVIILDVTDLLAWEVNLEYDPTLLTVTEHDVKLFQSANNGSAPIDISSRLPDTSGFHTLSAFESSDPPAVDSGSGVLARVTLETLAEGESELQVGSRDINEDGKQDRGTLIKNVDNEVIGDETGDEFFDGETTGAMVAIGKDCPAGSNAVTVTGESSGSGGAPWAFIAGGIAAVVVAGGLGVLLLARRRRTTPLGDDVSEA